jgi:flavin-dependent dehydrogenase
MTRVLIAGGGPIGLAAAIEARLAGLDVVVLEPRDGPIDKACGEGLMPGAVPALARLGVHPRGQPLRGVHYRDGTRSAVHRFRDGHGLGVRRTTLHAALAERARDLGATIERGRVEHIEQDDQGVRAAGHRADWLLAADGLHSAVARDLGLALPAPAARRRYGQRRHYNVEPWSDLIEVHWTPHGEIYVTPTADGVVGLALLARQGVRYEDALAAAPQLAERVRGAEPASELRGAGPFRQRTRARVRGRALLIGDASGYVDALTGEGIRIGLDQARAAVQAVLAGDAGAYEREWRAVTRDFRRLTGALVRLAASPLRPAIVPLARAVPPLYAGAVERLAR